MRSALSVKNSDNLKIAQIIFYLKMESVITLTVTNIINATVKSSSCTGYFLGFTRGVYKGRYMTLWWWRHLLVAHVHGHVVLSNRTQVLPRTLAVTLHSMQPLTQLIEIHLVTCQNTHSHSMYILPIIFKLHKIGKLLFSLFRTLLHRATAPNSE